LSGAASVCANAAGAQATDANTAASTRVRLNLRLRAGIDGLLKLRHILGAGCDFIRAG
jgi:hypothetical protein